MQYIILEAPSAKELESLVLDKLYKGYTLQGGVGILPVSTIIGEAKINANTNAAATSTLEILYVQAVVKNINNKQ